MTNEQLQELYNYLQPYCRAIYLGGSRVDKVIDNPHDVDYIFFFRHDLEWSCADMHYALDQYKKVHPEIKDDLTQFRSDSREQHIYWSYLNKLMILVAGEPINFQFDIIDQYRDIYIDILKKAAASYSNPERNQKRWYHLLRGYYILQNHSYAVTDEQKEQINILHDLSDGWEELKQLTQEYINKL